MPEHPISKTTFTRLPPGATDEQIVETVRAAMKEAETGLAVKVAEHPAVSTGPVHASLAVILAVVVDCPTQLGGGHHIGPL